MPQQRQTLPKLSIIIPARNEEHDIAVALRSVLDQQEVGLEVIVVNDHSTDRTGEIVEEIARSDPRVTVLHDPLLLPGWLGKANAMQFGAAQATGDYLVFTDADILHAPTCFTSALAVMEQDEYDFFSFMPLWVNESIWEHMNLPIYFVGFIKFLLTSGLDDPTSPDAVASGAFMMMKTTVFREVGGFECVKGEMFDDVGLARFMKAHHYHVGYWLAPECSRVRLFKTARDAFWGTTKNILGAVDGHATLALPLILVAVIQYWTPVLAFGVGCLEDRPLLIAAGLTAYFSQYLSLFSIRRLFSLHPLKLLIFPLVVVVSTCCILRATWYQIKGTIMWRGRAVSVRRRS